VSPGSQRMEGRRAYRYKAARSVAAALNPAERTTFLVAPQAVAPEIEAIEIQFTSGRQQHERSRICFSRSDRTQGGPLRVAYLPGESHPVAFGAHGAIAEHYKVDPVALKELHASTLDYAIEATRG